MKKILLIAMIMTFFLSSALGLSTFTHTSSPTISPGWVDYGVETNITFTVPNDDSSVDNITTIRIYSTLPATDPFNITAAYCPSGWTSDIQNSDPSNDSEMDTVECSNAILLPNDVAIINITISPTDLGSGNATQYGWTIITIDNNAGSPNSTKVANLQLGVDRKGPVIDVVSISESDILAGNISFNVTFDEAEVEINTSLYAVDLVDSCAGASLLQNSFTCNAGNTSCNLSYRFDSSFVSDGACGIFIWSLDTFGNNNSYQRNITTDNTGPTLSSNPPGTYVQFNATLNFSITDNFSNIDASWWSNDSGVTNNTFIVNYSINTTNWSGNSSSITIWSNDSLGNNASTNFTIYFDSTAPNTTILSPTTGQEITRGNSFNVEIEVLSDPGLNGTETCYLTLGVTSLSTLSYNNLTNRCQGNVLFPTTSSAGNYNLEVTISDMAGNEGQDEVQVTLINPATKKSSTSSGSRPSPPITLEVEEEGNLPPRITAPRIDIETPSQGQFITCVSGKFSDPDGDTKVGDKWVWYINGNALPGENSPILDTSNLSINSILTCSQKSTDGELYSETKLSSNSATVFANEDTNTILNTSSSAGDTNPQAGNAITGAFIGGLMGDDLLTVAVIITSVSGALIISVFHFIVRRPKLHFKFKK